MSKVGIIFAAFVLFGGCFQFIFFRRKRQQTQDRRKGYVQNESSSVSQQQSCHLSKKRKKTTRTFFSGASHFSGPQNLSKGDRFWQQAYRYGGR